MLTQAYLRRFSALVEWLEENAIEVGSRVRFVREDHRPRQQQLHVWYVYGEREWLVEYDKNGTAFCIQRVGQQRSHFLPVRVTELPTEQDIKRLCAQALYDTLEKAYPWETVSHVIDYKDDPLGAAILHWNGGVIRVYLAVDCAEAHD